MKKIYWILFAVFCLYLGSFIILSSLRESYNKIIVTSTQVAKQSSFVVFNLIYLTVGILLALSINVLAFFYTINYIVS